MNSNKRLYKSEEPIFAGVCGGIAEFFDFDTTLVRILTVVLVIAGFGLPIIAYLAAMVLMPKRTAGYPDYIDVKPAATTASSATAATAAANTASTAPAQKNGSANTATNAPGTAQNHAQAAAPTAAQAGTQAGVQGTASPGEVPPPQSPQSAPGSGYTAYNPQAYDCYPEQNTKQKRRGLHTGVKLGIVFVCIGVFALIGTFVNVALWRFWPLILVTSGFVVLFTPGKEGWSLARAGNAISIITVGFVLQLWTLDLINAPAFFHTFLNFWPVLLITLGLIIIGDATEKSVFKLFGSLIFSLALLIGVWSFGFSSEPLTIDLLEDYSIDISLPSSEFQFDWGAADPANSDPAN